MDETTSDAALAEAQKILYERIEALGGDLAKYRQALIDQLLVPYVQNSAWVITRNCSLADHPLRPPMASGRSSTGCVCGRVKAPKMEQA
jgi:hypothetical protein